MAWLYGSDAVQQLSENVVLYDLAQMRGNSAVLSRIPDNIGGVYAWYRRFEIDANAINDPQVFANYILEELCKEHSAPRETKLPPAHKIKLQAETSFSKELLLKELAADSSFRQLLFMLLNNSLIFQQPLYIGKATNLYSRIRSHIREGSILRDRLADAGHKINRCRLLIIHTSYNTNTVPDSVDEDDELDNQIEEDYEFSKLASDKLVEDILSRLFLPSFTLRYG
ncbi:GIY-YIG nuclease family protein [Nostoc sp. LEGE 12450]|uniref:GIY-YIG nuclease family protein n=1 Tax=Nostoc sp. LEGE 12450 TaxID=1828643 RepID=UPI00188227B2|nr:GIY-YIG nuclease family protein [Nostoc sp. LEGE 12450]MBE8989712.1 GIY-YIG nuclease family protein [Nostoc sp. LEGE 12450]MCC5605809.1 GIY-YIG nuclease family protein [Nostoc sp. CHAB 5834]